MKYKNIYSRGDVIVLIDENNIKTEIKNFKWYFYIKTDDFKSLGTKFWVDLQNQIGEYNKPILEDIQHCGEYVKLYTHNRNWFDSQYKDNRKILLEILKEHNIQTYEADYDSAKRYMIDNDIQFTTNYNICFWDIETDDRDGNMKDPKILSYSIREYARPIIYHKKIDDERTDIEEMVNKLKSYDIIATFNGRGFDRPVTINRMKKHNLIKKGKPNPWYEDIIHIDMYDRMQKVFKQDTKLIDYSLESFARRFLNRGKVDWRKESGCNTIYEVAQKHPDLLKKYNNEDCNLLNDLEQKLNVLGQMIALCAFAGQPISRFWISDILDMYICRQAHKRGIKLPTADTGARWRKLNKEEAKKRKKYTGGYVRNPNKGFYPRQGESGSVFVFDFKSLYPSIMRTLNMSMETWVQCDDWPTNLNELEEFINSHAMAANGMTFSLENDGIIKTLQGELLDLRKKYKQRKKQLPRGTPEYENAKTQEIVVKEMANSMYGIIGMKGTRYNTYFTDRGAEAITLTGQLCAKLLEYEVVPELKRRYPDQRFVVVHQDTDSIFIYSSMNLKFYSNEINEIFDKIIKDKLGIEENFIVLEYERTFKTLLMCEKKKYVGYVIDIGGDAVDEIYIKGLDRILKPTIQYTKKLLSDLENILLIEDWPLEKIINWLEIEKNKYLHHKEIDPNLLAIRKRTKGVESYQGYVLNKHGELKIKKDGTVQKKSIPAQAKLFSRLRKEGHILFDGQMLDYYVKIGYPKIEAEWLGNYQQDEDRRYYWNVSIFAPLERLLKTKFPDYNWNQHKITKKEWEQKYLEQIGVIV